MLVIEDIKKTRYGYNIFIDGNKINLESVIFSKHKIKKGDKFKTEEWNAILELNKLEFIKRKSLLYLNRSRSTKEFVTYLYKLEPPKGLIPSLVLEYTNKGYLNDYLYAETLIKKEKRRYGKNKIKEILINKGIKDEIINTLLNDFVDENLEQQIIAAIKTVKAINYNEAVKKLTRSFINKGYKLNEINNYIFLHLKKEQFNEKETIIKEYQKALKRYEKKFKDSELNLKIQIYLYGKGFNKDAINKVMRGE